MNAGLSDTGAAGLFRAVHAKKRYRPVVLLPVVAMLAACDVHLHDMSARATDEWTHTYPLTPGGEIEIENTNGKIDVEGADTPTVEVRAERIARGATDTAARELLPRIVIKEDATSDRVSIRTERMSGIMIGASFEVRYHVRAPKNAVVNVTNTNGQVTLTGLNGKVTAHTTNGQVKGDTLTGAIDARTTNGGVNIDLSAIGREPVRLHTTNGAVTLTLPESGKADISASVTNGGISVGDFQNLDVSEKSRRRFEGRLNGGGTSIELQTTNGGVRIRPRNSIADTATGTENEREPKRLREPAERDR
jgi:putative adhesin